MSKKSHLTAWQFSQKLWSILTPIHGKLILLAISILLLDGTMTLLPLFQKFIIDGLIAGESFQKLFIIIILWFSAHTTLNFLSTLKWVWRDKIWRRMELLLEKHVTSKVLAFSVGQFTNENTGIKVTKINRGHDSLLEIFFDILQDVGPTTIMIMVNSLALFILDWRLGIFGIILILANLIHIRFTFPWLLPRQKKQEKLWRKLGTFKWELFHNVDVVKQNAKEFSSRQLSLKKLDGVWKMILSTWNPFAFMDFGRITGTTIIVGGLLVTGIWMVTQDMLTTGSLVVALSWMNGLRNQMRNLGWIQQSLVKRFEPARALFEMLETPPAITFPDSAPKLNFQGHIKFQNVSFNYEAKKPALKHVSFEIKPGQRVAFVGESGSGKTTITRLLQRFYDPTSGKIFIDGHDLKSIHLPTFLQQTGVVSQDVKLFDTTLKKNIIYSLPKGTKISQARLKEVINQSRINKFWHRLTKGFDTLLGENGVKLSGGEKQRVSIARALIKNPKLLIFDEATSSLDVESESEIQAAITEISKNRTTIIVAHRLSTIISADHIFVMSKGNLVGQGTHLDLMKSNKIYSNLMQIQVRDLLSASFPNLDNKGMDKILKDLKII